MRRIGQYHSTQDIRWKYLAVYKQQFLGSKDGSSWKIIIDALNGKWNEGGFFTGFGEGCEPFKDTLSNDFTSMSGFAVSDVAEEGGCEYYQQEGVGTICDDYSWKMTRKEYYKSGIGPIGYYSHSESTYSGGGISDRFTNTLDIGLTDSLIPAERPLDTTSPPSTPPGSTSTPPGSSPAPGSSKIEEKTEPGNGSGDRADELQSPSFLWSSVGISLLFFAIIAGRKRK